MILVMIPLAITELGTDSWITELLTPAMNDLGVSAGWVLVYAMTIVMVLRLFAGPIVHKFSPLGLLAISALVAVFSPADIVKMLTGNAAVCTGDADVTGTLTVGKQGDIVMVDGDPLTDIFAVLDVRLVAKGGVVVSDQR